MLNYSDKCADVLLYIKVLKMVFAFKQVRTAHVFVIQIVNLSFLKFVIFEYICMN